MIKALLHETYTKRDVNGNVYHAVRITNPKNGEGFTVDTPSMGNVTHILNEIFPEWNRTGKCPYYMTESCTGSTRLNSLPSKIYLNCCHGNEEWRKALRSIGYRVSKA